MKSLTAARNLGLAALASLTLGGCYYGDVNGASYASADCYSRYGDQYWSQDPYAYDDATYGYDCYDAADYGSGFVQIGFGGGWYQQLYYPGYGMFLFDRYGRRHSMGHDYLTYWGGRRAWWKHHGHRYGNHDGRRGDGRHDGRRPGRGYAPGAVPQPGPGDRRWDNGNWGNGPGAAPVPGERRRGDGWRGRPRGDMNGGAAPLPAPMPDVGVAPPPMRRGDGWRGRGSAQGGGNWAPPAMEAPPVSAAPPPPPREVREPRYTPPPASAPEVTYTPPPPVNRARDNDGPIRED
jgi:hypothetical protein